MSLSLRDLYDQSKNEDIQKLRRGQILPHFKARPLARFVREYQRAGGQVIFKDDLNPYSIS